MNESSNHVNVFLDEMLAIKKPNELYKASKHLIDAGGKRLRPFIVLKSCELVGGDMEKALPMAVAVELIHNFTLVHDDIMDEDSRRRNAPTVHVVYGTPIAINAGDMLFAKAYEAALLSLLKGVTPLKLLHALDSLTEGIVAICEGQALDMSFEKRDRIDELEYMEMIEKKTAALLIASAKIGAIIGGGSKREVSRLSRSMRASGLAFQIVDDILGVTADEKVLGKPVGSDIREGKRTLIICHSIKHAGKQQKDILLKVLGNKNASSGEIKDAIEILKSTGSLNYALRKAESLTVKAKAELDAFPSSDARDLLISLVDYIVARDR